MTRLGRGLGTLSLSDLGEMRNDVETLLWGEGRDGMYTDGKILITDKTVGNKIVEKFREQYIKQYIKKYVTAKKKMSVQEAEIARQRAEKEIAENIKDNNFPETKEILQDLYDISDGVPPFTINPDSKQIKLRRF